MLISGIRVRSNYLIVIHLLILAVSGQECTDKVTVGSLSHDNNIVTADQTFILAGYTVPCSGTVVAWEFCYRIGTTSVTFYPGIWRITGTTGNSNVNADYELVQSNNITYDSRGDPTNLYPCQIFNLSDTDQFTAPAKSVVGLYITALPRPQLLHTNTDSLITTYQFSGNQTSVSVGGNSNNMNYNITIRVHLVSANAKTVISTTSTPGNDMSTTPTVMVPPSGSPAGGEVSSSNMSSGSGGVIAGVVVGIVCVIIVVVVLLILLVWYKRRQRKMRSNKSTQVHYAHHADHDSKRRGSEDDKLGDHHYSVVGRQVEATIKDNIADRGTVDNIAYIDSKPNEIMHYMDPTSTTLKAHSKASSDDYEALPSINEYETPHFQLSNTPYYYQVTAPSSSADDTEYSTLDEALPIDEQIYEDPGHREEKIYAWFETKKFRKIRGKDIRVLQVLGSGEFGVVSLGLWSNGSTDPVQVAVKTLNSQCSESDRVKFLREGAIMGQFKHDNVVQLHGVVIEEKNMMIVLEYMSEGDLRKYLTNLKTTTPPDAFSKLESDLLSFCRQIAAGMSYLASKQFVHRDLAARNILVSSDDVCKIADFGMARDVADDTYYFTSGGKMPLKWTAPEAILYKKFSTQSDVWSFGCVMYEVWSFGYKPFKDVDGIEYVQKITTGYRLPPPPGCPRAMYELMIQCWHPIAKSRPTSGSISQTLQKSDRALLTSSVQVTDDDVTSESQSMMLGAPLTAGSQLYLDLQQRYANNSS